MAVTKNFPGQLAGVLVASNAGDVLVTVNDPGMTWAIGNSASTAPTVAVRHSMTGFEASPTLEAGEHLWVFGLGIAAVTGNNSV